MTKKSHEHMHAVGFYMCILFACAFSLLLLAYFMQERAYAAQAAAELASVLS